MARTIEARLFVRYRVNTETGCWEWLGSRVSKRYGGIRYRGKQWRVHRLAAVLWLGFNDDPAVKVRHKCDNTICFNPAHLLTGTHQDNMDDMKGRGRQRGNMGEHNRKLSPEQVREIEQSSESLRTLARRYGVHNTVIHRIRKGKRANTANDPAGACK